jgi:hypothetical protein
MPTGDISLDAPAGCANNATTTASAFCFPELDPLVLEQCSSAGTPAWVNPMLEELVASLVMSHPAAQAPRCSAATAASQDADTTLGATRR